MSKFLSTDPYKGVRDFYPEDMAIQRYIFDTWSKTAEQFGFERYDASVLEPSELYKSKGAENEEMVNEQTYTFIDRGDREVTLRPEMTPTVARMVSGRRRELSFPVRWYSIPNLFRYERTQRGRLREHWQLNCDMFGANDFTADVEVIALAYQLLINFGATPEMFEIRINDRQLMTRLYRAIGVDDALVPAITRLNDRRRKISADEYRAGLVEILGNETLAEEVILILDQTDEQTDVVVGLAELGITNVVFDKSLARGFDYYTGTIFEIFDTDPENNRSMLGGGRYDNLTGLFGGEPIGGVGFGMGDVTMRNFLESHQLLQDQVPRSVATVLVAPTDATANLAAQKIAHQLRIATGLSVATDISTKKIGKKISDAAERGNVYLIVVGENEIRDARYTLKHLESGATDAGTIDELAARLTAT